MSTSAWSSGISSADMVRVGIQITTAENLVNDTDRAAQQLIDAARAFETMVASVTSAGEARILITSIVSNLESFGELPTQSSKVVVLGLESVNVMIQELKTQADTRQQQINQLTAREVRRLHSVLLGQLPIRMSSCMAKYVYRDGPHTPGISASQMRHRRQTGALNPAQAEHFDAYIAHLLRNGWTLDDWAVTAERLKSGRFESFHEAHQAEHTTAQQLAAWSKEMEKSLEADETVRFIKLLQLYPEVDENVDKIIQENPASVERVVAVVDAQ